MQKEKAHTVREKGALISTVAKKIITQICNTLHLFFISSYYIHNIFWYYQKSGIAPTGSLNSGSQN